MNLTAVSAWWNNLFVAVLQRSLGALWLIPAVLVLRLILKRSPKWVSCLLWALVAVELVCPVQISSPLSVRNVAPKSPPVKIRYTEEIEKPELFVDFPAVPGYPDNHHTRTAKQNIHTSDLYIPPLRSLWLAGAALMLTYGTFSTLRLRRRVAAALPTEANVWICDSIDTPFVLGVVRPRIYLPSALGEQERDSVLAHERAHIQRGDHWWKLLGFLILAVYWFHPLVWLSYLLLGRDIELACDEKVCRGMSMAQRKRYAQTLLSLSASRSTMMASPLGFGEIGVKERVKNVAKYKKPTVLVTVAAVVLVLFASVAFGTQGQEVEKLTLALQELTISKVGDEVQLTADGGNGVYTWESDTPAVAQVDNNGVVTGKAAGAATVRCTCIDGQSAECKVTVQDSSPETYGDYPPMVMVNDTIYKDTGYKTSALSCGTMDGKITSSVDSSEIPTKNDESNFGTGYEYQYSSEGQLIVVINDECFIFKALNASSNSVNYQARSDELLTKARLVTEFEPYGVNYDGEHDHVMYDGQIVSYIERSIDTTDPSTLPEHPDNEGNADPDGTVILRFLMDEVEKETVSYDRLMLFDAKTRELLEDTPLDTMVSDANHEKNSITLSEAIDLADMYFVEHQLNSSRDFLRSAISQDADDSYSGQGNDGRRSLWNLVFAQRDGNKDYIIHIDAGVVTECEEDGSLPGGVIAEIDNVISTPKAKEIAASYGLLPGDLWPIGYDYELEVTSLKSSPDEERTLLTVYGKTEDSSFANVILDAYTGQVMAASQKQLDSDGQATWTDW